jgi:hypothetical protein
LPETAGGYSSSQDLLRAADDENNPSIPDYLDAASQSSINKLVHGIRNMVKSAPPAEVEDHSVFRVTTAPRFLGNIAGDDYYYKLWDMYDKQDDESVVVFGYYVNPDLKVNSRNPGATALLTVKQSKDGKFYLNCNSDGLFRHKKSNDFAENAEWKARQGRIFTGLLALFTESKGKLPRS